MLIAEMMSKLISCIPAILAGIGFIILCGVLSDYIAPRSKVLMRFVEWFAGSLEDEE